MAIRSSIFDPMAAFDAVERVAGGTTPQAAPTTTPPAVTPPPAPTTPPAISTPTTPTPAIPTGAVATPPTATPPATPAPAPAPTGGGSMPPPGYAFDVNGNLVPAIAGPGGSFVDQYGLARNYFTDPTTGEEYGSWKVQPGFEQYWNPDGTPRRGGQPDEFGNVTSEGIPYDQFDAYMQQFGGYAPAREFVYGAAGGGAGGGTPPASPAGYVPPNRSILGAAMNPAGPADATPNTTGQPTTPGGTPPAFTSDPGAGPRGSSGIPPEILAAVLGGTPPTGGAGGAGGGGAGGGTPGGGSPFTPYGPGNDLRGTQINPVPSERFGRITGQLDTALEGLAGPDRGALAQEILDQLITASQPDYDARVRGVGQSAAKFGTLGAGMNNTRLADLATEREQGIDLARRGLASEAAGLTLADRQSVINALRGAQGDQYGFDFDARNEFRTERGFQNQMQQQALNDFIRLLMTEDSLVGSDFGRGLDYFRTLIGGGFGNTPGGQYGGSGGNQDDVTALFQYLYLNGFFGGQQAGGGAGSGGSYTAPGGYNA